MSVHERERQAARLRTLEKIRAELYSDDGLTLRLRTPVLCSPELKSWRPIPKCATS